MSANFKVRNLREEEQGQHLSILNLCFDPWGNEEAWERKYKQPGVNVTKNILVVEEDGKWIGGLSLWVRDILITGKRAKVYLGGDVYCHPDHVGKGVYSAATKAYRKMVVADRDAALSLTFVSKQELPFGALQRHGYCPILYPATKIKLLKPERLANLLDGRELKMLERLQGANIRIATKSGDLLFVVKDGHLRRVAQTERVDIVVRSDLQSLFRVYGRSMEGKRALVGSAMVMILTGRLSVRVAFRSIPRLIRGILGW